MNKHFTHTRADGAHHGLAVRNQAEVARIMGLTRRAVDKLERRALHKLRSALLPYLLE